MSTCQYLPPSTQIDVQASGIPDVMIGALADLKEEKDAGSSAMPSLGAALLLSGREAANAGLASLSTSIREPQPWARPASQLPFPIKWL